MLLAGVVLAITFYQVMFPGLTYFRMWCCCYGAIRPLRVIMFDFTTMDIQVSTANLSHSVSKNLENARLTFTISAVIHHFINANFSSPQSSVGAKNCKSSELIIPIVTEQHYFAPREA